MSHPSIPALRFNGRTFSVEELRLIQEVSASCAALGRTEMARTVCELLHWKRPTGRLKNHESRRLLERMQELGWLQLPPVRPLGRKGPRLLPASAQSDPEAPVTGAVGELTPLSLEVVPPGPASRWPVYAGIAVALAIGVLHAFGIWWLPQSTLVLVFIVMAVTLIVRPYGLLGRPGTPAAIG